MTSCEHLRRRGGWREDILERRCIFPIGPRNTWSNVAYGAAAVAVGWPRTPEALVAAGALVALGAGSFWYHGWKTLAANRADHAGMLVVAGAVGTHAIAAGHPLLPWAMAATGVALALAFAVLRASPSVTWVMGLMLWVAAVPTVLFGSVALTLAGLAVFLLAWAAWHIDRGRDWLGRWGHALWHVGTAAAISLLWWAR